jgi:hypothetical protein
MKSRLFALAVISPLLPSCSTGDPSSGGLFGWSPSKFNQRIEGKRQVHSEIEADTARQREEAARLQRQIDARN